MLWVMSREDYREPAAVEIRSARRFRHLEIWITARADCSICVDDNLSTMRPLGFRPPPIGFRIRDCNFCRADDDNSFFGCFKSLGLEFLQLGSDCKWYFYDG